MIRLFLIVCADRLAVVFFAVLLFWSSGSFAAAYTSQPGWSGPNGYFPTPTAACNAFGYGEGRISSQSPTLADCKDGDVWLPGMSAQGQSCPSGGSIQGSLCVDAPDCPAGQDYNQSGQCAQDCTRKLGMALPNDMYSVGAGRKGNFWGCEIQCAKGTSGIAITNLLGGQMEFLGEACSYTGKPEQPDNVNSNSTGRNKPKEKEPWKPEDCLGKGDGYIQSSSGTVTCVPSKEAPEGQKPDKVTEAKTKSSSTNGGDTIKTTTESIRTGGSGGGSGTASGGGGGTVKTTETSTTEAKPDSNGVKTCPAGFVQSGDTCTQTKTTETSAKSFCDENPKSYICNGEGGDDMCSKAENKSLAACTDLGKPEDTQGDLATKPFNLTAIPTVAFAASNTCPSSINLPHGAVFTFEPICDAMGWLRPIVLAMAWLSAGLIVVGALRT